MYPSRTGRPLFHDSQPIALNPGQFSLQGSVVGEVGPGRRNIAEALHAHADGRRFRPGQRREFLGHRLPGGFAGLSLLHAFATKAPQHLILEL
jgi:hypothetical protein